MFWSFNKKIIGRLERVSIPDLNLKSIVAKIDTGAYNSVVHVSYVEEFIRENKKYIRFVVLDEEHPEFTNQVHEISNFSKKIIRNSSGITEDRYVIPVKIILKGLELKAKVSLSDRREMRHPILLGRKIIKKHFVVDASKNFTN